MKRWTNLLGLLTRQRKLPEVGVTPCDVAWTENKWRLLHYRARPQGLAFKTPLLLVPSLINRHYVLDLMPGKSFTEAMVAAGHDVWTIDWGTPGPEDRFLSFDDVCDRILGRALKVCAGDGQAHVLGYCMGGTLAAIHAAVRPERIASLIALAAPVRFHDEGLLSRWTNSKTFDIDALIDACGNAPWQVLQSSFQMLRPTLPLAKAVGMLDKAWNDEFLDGFLALETWGNDNVSLPGEFYRRYVKDLYRADGLVNETFTLSGKPVRLSAIQCPTLAVTFEHDNIVLPESAAVLLERIGSKDKQRIHLPGGHVGAVVSRAASKGLWPQLSQWLAARETRPDRRASRLGVANG
jgi:polyhydroxyalkanoate synthase subunit PhaC